MTPIPVGVPGLPPPPPPPPVPPPHPPAQQNVGSKSLELGHTEKREITEEDFVKEIHELIANSTGVIEGDVEDKITLVVATPLHTVILQNGPMCGIVALAEALEILNNRKIMTDNQHSALICPKTILDEAIRKGYTKQGEMFSVRAMQSLAVTFGSSPEHSKIVEISKDHQKSGNDSEISDQEFFNKIALHLINECPVLFPYDADHNHTPSLRKGHAAHWAVIHGLTCSVPYLQLLSILKQDSTSTTTLPFQTVLSNRNLVILKPSPDTEANNVGADYNENDPVKLLLASLFTYENTHVIAHQGKSFRAALWKYSDLLKSNRNLKEVAPKIMAEEQNFVIHEGIEEGLCSKILLLK